MSTPSDFRFTPNQIPLADRLNSLLCGLASDSAVLDAKLSRINRFPLALWFDLHPERLFQLSQAFPCITTETSFGEAAAQLYRQPPTGPDGAPAPGPLELAAMWLLISPLIDMDALLVQTSNERKGGAIQWRPR